MEETNEKRAEIKAIMIDKPDDKHNSSVEINGKVFDILELLSDVVEVLIKNEVDLKDILLVVTLGFDKANAS